jgi:hypothetical protein
MENLKNSHRRTPDELIEKSNEYVSVGAIYNQNDNLLIGCYCVLLAIDKRLQHIENELHIIRINA